MATGRSLGPVKTLCAIVALAFTASSCKDGPGLLHPEGYKIKQNPDNSLTVDRAAYPIEVPHSEDAAGKKEVYGRETIPSPLPATSTPFPEDSY